MTTARISLGSSRRRIEHADTCHLREVGSKWSIALGTLVAILVAGCSITDAAGARRIPFQMVVVLDVSASMKDHWKDVHGTLDELFVKIPASVPLGLATVEAAGDGSSACHSQPSVRLAVGTSRSVLRATMDGEVPDASATNLNETLLATPALFRDDPSLAKRLLLVTDGRNNCAPTGSACELARELRARHGIALDVAALTIDRDALDEFRCAAAESGGVLFASTLGLPDHYVPSPWPVVTAAAGLAAVLAASRMLYRQAVHVWCWEIGHAVLAATSFFGLGFTVLVTSLFLARPLAAALGGSAALAGVVGLDRHGAARRSRYPTPGAGGFIALLALVLSALPGSAAAAAAAAESCRQPASPPVHQEIYVDLSASMARHIGAMRRFFLSYVSECVAPGDTVRLSAFGEDGSAAPRVLASLAVRDPNDAARLAAAIDALRITTRRDSRTLYGPLVADIETAARGARSDVIVMIASDRQTDDPTHDIAFEQLSTRPLLHPGGASKWVVGVQGGSGISLERFASPTGAGLAEAMRAPRRPAVVDACLLEPGIRVTTPDHLELEPSLVPRDRRLHGTLAVGLALACDTSRTVDVTVRMRVGEHVESLGAARDVVLTAVARTLSMPVLTQATAGGPFDAVIEVESRRGSTSRVASPLDPPYVRIEPLTYLRAHGIFLAAAGAGAGVILMVIVVAAHHLRRNRAERPLWLRIAPHAAMPLVSGDSVEVVAEPIGGARLTAQAGGDARRLGTLSWLGVPGRLQVRAAPGLGMWVTGAGPAEAAEIRLGQGFEFRDAEGSSWPVRITEAPAGSRAVVDRESPFAFDPGRPGADAAPGAGAYI